MNPTDVVRKARKVLTEPSLLRYRVLGRLGRFPVGRIDNPVFTDLPIYCVSLRRAPERRAQIHRQVEAAGWRGFRFFDAVDAKALDVGELVATGVYDPDGARLHHGEELAPTVIACTLSHGRLYEEIVRAGHDRALVIEDDALLETRRLRRFDLSLVPADWDIVFLSSFVHEKPPHGHVAGNVYGTESWHGSSAAYLITGDAAARLASAYLPVRHAADGVLGRNMEALPGVDHPFRQRGAATSLRCYLVWPDPIVNGSDVHFNATTLRPPGR